MLLLAALAVALFSFSFTADGTTVVDAGQSAGKPQLRVSVGRPLLVMGSGFRPGENVRVTVRGLDARGSKRVEATAAGRIAVRFAGLKLGRCPYYLVVANGDEGSTARLRSIPPACGIDPGQVP
jgi:hypothetical protein